MKGTVLVAAAAAVTLAACATPEPGSPAWVAMQEHKRQEARADAVKDSVGDLPSWYLSPPTDGHSVLAPGTATSGDLQLALDKAVIGAKRELADRLNSQLSSKLKEFLSESGAAEDARVMAETERATSNLITDVNLAGYEIKEKKVIPSGVQYRAYVLIQYPLGSANRILMERVKKNDVLESRLRASKAFQDLEKDIAGARAAQSPAPDAAPRETVTVE